MNAVLTFDLNDSNGIDQLKSLMMSKGYLDRWTTNNPEGQTEVYILPHNMIWRKETDFNTAHADMLNCLQELNSSEIKYTLKRFITLNSTPWGGIKGVI